MNKQNTNTTLTSYFNNIVIHFYEDNARMESAGKQFGIDVNQDCFLAMSFVYPSDMVVSYEDKQLLVELLAPLMAYGPLNKPIDSPQFLTCDKGTVLILIAHTREELLNASGKACHKAVELLEQNLPDTFICVGVGTPESGLSGIECTYQNSLRAVNAGEKFKKERRVLDFIGMEIYSAINAMVLAHGHALISTILLQLTDEEQTILGKYYKSKEQVTAVASTLGITEDNFKLNFVMIAKRALEKEKRRR